MKMQFLSNGNIIADNIPDILKPKYEQSQNDPRLWILKWPLCIYKSEKNAACPRSGRMKMMPWCKLLDCLISPNKCQGCPYRKES